MQFRPFFISLVLVHNVQFIYFLNEHAIDSYLFVEENIMHYFLIKINVQRKYCDFDAWLVSLIFNKTLKYSKFKDLLRIQAHD